MTAPTVRFTVHDDVFALLPDACFGVVLATDLDNATPRPGVEHRLDEAVRARADQLAGVRVKDGAALAPYRDAFTRLGINPNKFLCSIEALLTRVGKRGDLPHINPAVDLGNAWSLTHQVPIGAHDVAALVDGELAVRPARPGDSFRPFGETEPEGVDEGEVVYATGSSVRTRRWIWRQSDEGKITGDTRSVLFPLDGFAVNADAVRAARDGLAESLRDEFGCEVRTGWVDAAHPSVEFG